MVAVAQSNGAGFFLAAAGLLADVQVKADVQVRPSKDHNAVFVAGARRGQPYGFRFCESFAQFAIFGPARCIFRGRRKTRPTLWSQILRKLRTIFSFWTCEMHFVWQAQDAANLMVSDFAKASHNLQFLDLRDAFCVAGAGRGQPYGFRFCESFAQFAVFGLARCILCGRRRTRPTFWSFFVAGAVREHKS